MTDGGNLPLYVEIQRDIERHIVSGEWRPGFRVPSEMELTEQYACSRMTVNKALSSLAAAGLIVRKRRSGSFVSIPRVEEPILKIHDIKADTLASGKAYDYTILERTVRTVTGSEEAAYAGVPEGTRMLVLEIVHYADREPAVWELREINLDAVPEAEDEPFDDTPPGSWLLYRVPWSEVEHAIRAISADKLTAERLRIAKGEACLSMERRTWKNSQPVTHVSFVYPGEKHHFVARFTPPAS